MGMWAWVGGLDDFGTPGDHVEPIVLGLAGNMANSMTIGVVFAALMILGASLGEGARFLPVDDTAWWATGYTWPAGPRRDAHRRPRRCLQTTVDATLAAMDRLC